MYPIVQLLLLWLWPASADAQCPAPVTIIRMAGDEAIERTRMRLVTCDGAPDPVALDELSVLARPLTVDSPDRRNEGGAFVATGILRLHPGLLDRLQRIADRFPDRAIEIVSGYRPRARRTSRHRTGRALDLRVQGVTAEELCRFVQAFDETGVGYYPNSTFSHIDVRERSMHWVDQSAPGERARYGRVPGDPFPEHDPAMGLSSARRRRDRSAGLRPASAQVREEPTAEGADDNSSDDEEYRRPENQASSEVAAEGPGASAPNPPAPTPSPNPSPNPTSEPSPPLDADSSVSPPSPARETLPAVREDSAPSAPDAAVGSRAGPPDRGRGATARPRPSLDPGRNQRSTDTLRPRQRGRAAGRSPIPAAARQDSRPNAESTEPASAVPEAPLSRAEAARLRARISRELARIRAAHATD
ncbi:MAG: DUF882 domain-containing protein [Myxococcota bacterium]